MAWKCERHQNCPAERRRRSHYTHADGEYVTGLVCPDCHGLLIRQQVPTGKVLVYCPEDGYEPEYR